MDGGRGRSGGSRSAQGPLRRRRLRGGAPAVRGSGPGRAARGRAASGGSFLEERCHLKEAEDRDARVAAGIGATRSPLPPAAAAPAWPGVPPAGSGARVLEAPEGGLSPAVVPWSWATLQEGGERHLKPPSLFPRGWPGGQDCFCWCGAAAFLRGSLVKAGPWEESERERSSSPPCTSEPSHHILPLLFWDHSPVYRKDNSLPQFTQKAGGLPWWWLRQGEAGSPILFSPLQASVLPCPGADKCSLHRRLPSAAVLGSRKADFY